jgi:hypothetical protein
MPTNNYKHLSNVRTLIIVFIILVLGMLAAYYYFFRQVENTGEKVSVLSNETTSLVSEESNLNSLRAVFSATTNEREKINSYFIQSDGAVDFLTTIENLATFAGLSNETQSVTTEEDSPTSNTREWLHITFKTKGTWQNTYYFISLLESLPYNLVIHKIDLIATGGTGTLDLSGPTLNLSNSSSTTPTPPKIKSSLWEGTYDFSVKKFK